MKKEQLVSVIVTTRNEVQNIGACIESLQKQTYPFIEIIVVDNHSSDGTKDSIRRYGITPYDKGPERSAQRNFGAQKAKGDYVFFIDADMILPPHIVEECLRVIALSKKSKKEFVALIIPEISIGIGFWAECKALERSFYIGVDWIEAARFYKKQVFTKLKGYDESLTGPEDFDIHQRLRDQCGQESIGRLSLFIQHNEGNLSLWKTIGRNFTTPRI